MKCTDMHDNSIIKDSNSRKSDRVFVNSTMKLLNGSKTQLSNTSAQPVQNRRYTEMFNNCDFEPLRCFILEFANTRTELNFLANLFM